MMLSAVLVDNTIEVMAAGLVVVVVNLLYWRSRRHRRRSSSAPHLARETDSTLGAGNITVIGPLEQVARYGPADEYPDGIGFIDRPGVLTVSYGHVIYEGRDYWLWDDDRWRTSSPRAAEGQ